MPKIAISYRRTDSDATGRIFDRLRQRFGKESVFRDIDDIPFGIDFREVVNDALQDTDVLIAIVGPNWSGAGARESARIDDANDFVRIEVETALHRNIPVIPVLIGGVTMPLPDELPDSLRAFSYRNAASIDSGRNFDTDIERLMRSMERLMERRKRARAQKEASPPAAPEPGKAPVFITETGTVAPASHKPNGTALREEVISSQVIDAKSRTPIVFAAVFALASFPLWWGARLFTLPWIWSVGFRGELVGSILMVVSALVLLRWRWAEITGTEIALYWLGLSFAVTSPSPMGALFSMLGWNGNWGELTVTGSILMIASALVLLCWRWAEITGTEIALCWPGLS
jgi:hypothetical protein